MANVLPKESRKHLRRLQRSRILLAIAYAVFAVSLTVFVALLPAAIILYSASRAGSTSTSQVQSPSDDDRAALQEVRELVFVLKPVFTATTTPTQVIQHVLSLKPPTIAIDHITYTPADGAGTIALSGTSQTPSALNAYRSALAADSRFANVSVPVGDLIGSDDGRFTMTIKGTY
ncbi:MAG TPA: hypothetical protein VJG64_03735 [Candidatus Paceibacterota bacterium]